MPAPGRPRIRQASGRVWRAIGTRDGAQGTAAGARVDQVYVQFHGLQCGCACQARRAAGTQGVAAARTRALATTKRDVLCWLCLERKQAHLCFEPRFGRRAKATWRKSPRFKAARSPINMKARNGATALLGMGRWLGQSHARHAAPGDARRAASAPCPDLAGCQRQLSRRSAPAKPQA